MLSFANALGTGIAYYYWLDMKVLEEGCCKFEYNKNPSNHQCCQLLLFDENIEEGYLLSSFLVIVSENSWHHCKAKYKPIMCISDLF